MGWGQREVGRDRMGRRDRKVRGEGGGGVWRTFFFKHEAKNSFAHQLVY